MTPQRNLKVGDLVLLHGEPAFRYQYARAIVTAVQPDKFGQVLELRFEMQIVDSSNEK